MPKRRNKKQRGTPRYEQDAQRYERMAQSAPKEQFALPPGGDTVTPGDGKSARPRLGRGRLALIAAGTGAGAAGFGYAAHRRRNAVNKLYDPFTDSVVEFGKSDNPNGQAGAARRITAGAFGGWHSLAAGRRGEKGKAFLSTLGHTAGGAAAGVGASLLSRGKLARTMTYGGAQGGNQLAVSSNQRKGRYKQDPSKVRKAVSGPRGRNYPDSLKLQPSIGRGRLVATPNGRKQAGSATSLERFTAIGSKGRQMPSNNGRWGSTKLGHYTKGRNVKKNDDLVFGGEFNTFGGGVEVTPAFSHTGQFAAQNGSRGTRF